MIRSISRTTRRRLDHINCIHVKYANAELCNRHIWYNNEVIGNKNIKYFSDKALGYSPMSPASYNPQILNPNSKEIPTERDVEIAGNIFSLQSAKRDKLAELKVESMANDILSLDDAASDIQKLDLWLVDGLIFISNYADTNRINVKIDELENCNTDYNILYDIIEYCNEKMQDQPSFNQLQWEEFLTILLKKVELSLSVIPSDRCLKDVRDYYETTSIQKMNDDDKILLEKFNNQQIIKNENIQLLFHNAVIRFRLLQTKVAIENLQKSFKILTKYTDQDIDRAAVDGLIVEELKSLPTNKLYTLLQSYLLGNCEDRVDSLWSLIDKDNDGLLDEEEMVIACTMAIEPIGQAVKSIVQEAIEASPVRSPLPEFNDEIDNKLTTPTLPTKMGWRQRRLEKNESKRLLNLFNKTLKNHFKSEIEIAHRLRCSYAWANKSHQDNKINSVLVDDTGWSGRKRYVELKPKIALNEFREVQAEHIKHLNRISKEYLQSYREDLLIQQGRGRQNKELMRDCSIFMIAVCGFDFIITTM